MAYAELDASEVAALAHKAVETWTAKHELNPSAPNRDGLAVAKRVLALANLAQSMVSGPKTITLTDVDCLTLVEADVESATSSPKSVRAGFIGA